MATTVSIRSAPKGVPFVRFACALGLARGSRTEQLKITDQWIDSPVVSSVLRAFPPAGRIDWWLDKATIAPGTVADTNWASALAQYQNLVSEFVALLRPATIAGRLAMRKVPFNIRFPAQTGAASVAWIGENVAVPASALSLTSDTLGFAKAAGIVVITKELAELSSPSAQTLVSNELQKAMVNFLDAQLVDPAVAAVSNVSPASITNGITAQISSGNTATQLASDFASMIATMADANVPFDSPAWIMRPADAAKLAMKRDTAGAAAFPDVTVDGGSLGGIPIVTSNGVPGSVSGGSIIILVDASSINYADEGLITVDASDEASVQMVDNPVSTATQQVSLWQNNLVGIRCVAYRNWMRRHDAAVAYLDQVHL